MPKNDDTLMEFPCNFPIKAMGLASQELEPIILQIVQRHAPEASESALHKRESSNGKYLSVTVTILATSRAQLDAIYMELTAHDSILMAL